MHYLQVTSVYVQVNIYYLSLLSSFLGLQTERTYFQVYLPKESKDASQPMFFCSKWSVGKVVDYAASLASLKNNNNVLTAKVKDVHLCILLNLFPPPLGLHFFLQLPVLSS